MKQTLTRVNLELESRNPCGEILLRTPQVCNLWCPDLWPSYQERLENGDCDD
jgi:hypothetical protein